MSVTMHMVASLDGFIARKDDDLSWMESSWGAYDKGEEMTADVLETIECYVMGSKTFELTRKLGWPYGDTPAIVTTSRELMSDRNSVEFYSGDLKALADKLTPKNVWVVGGPTLCDEFLRLGLVDQICLSIVPILLGDGVPLYHGGERKLLLKETTAFKNGMIDLWYDVCKDHDG